VNGTALAIGIGAIALVVVWKLATSAPAPAPLQPTIPSGLGVPFASQVPYGQALAAINAPLQKYIIDPVNRKLQDAGIGMPLPKGSLTPTSSANAVLADAICQCYHGYGSTYNGASACDAANATVPGGNFKNGDADCHPTFPDGNSISFTNSARRAASLPSLVLPIRWNAPGGIKNKAAVA
jgi:hypothetical protein